MTERQLVTDAEALEHRYSILIQGAASGWTELMDFADRLLATRTALKAALEAIVSNQVAGSQSTAERDARALLAELHGEKP
jgi:hypothetical protein